MIFLMRTDATGRVPQQDIDLVTNSMFKGFSWTIIWIEKASSVKWFEVPLLVPMSDDHHQRTAEARMLAYYSMSDGEQVKVRRALGTLESAFKLILKRIHVPETERHLLELRPENIDDSQECRRRFEEDAKYSTMFEFGTWDELGVTDFIAWAKVLEDPFHERILS